MTSLRLLAKCLSWVSHSAPFYKQNRRQKWSGKHGSYKQIWRTWKRHELDAQLWIYIHWEYTRGLNWGWLRPCMQELVTPFPSAYARPLLNSAWQAGDWVAPAFPVSGDWWDTRYQKKISHTRNSTFQVQLRVNQIFTTLVNHIRRQQALIRSWLARAREANCVDHVSRTCGREEGGDGGCVRGLGCLVWGGPSSEWLQVRGVEFSDHSC